MEDVMTMHSWLQPPRSTEWGSAEVIPSPKKDVECWAEAARRRAPALRYRQEAMGQWIARTQVEDDIVQQLVESVHAQQVHVQEVARQLAQRFAEEANKWERETRYVSSMSDIVMHPSYQAIIKMGLSSPSHTLSLLLHDMQTTGRPWFSALAAIAKENPIKAEDAGKVKKMTKDWLKWGEKKGLL